MDLRDGSEMLLTRVVLVAACLSAGTAAAQSLPSEPITLGNGRVVLGGDVAASFGADDPGFFNYGDYEHSALRQLRLGLRAQVRAGERLSVLGELRTENFDTVSPFALYVRVRPWPSRRLDIQAGRVPTAFGRFARAAYGRDNPLIGYPLAYQYLTSLRADALPADAAELLAMRARGWRSSFSVGSAAAAPGVPLVSALRWDTGVQVTTGWKAVTLTGGLTNGTVSNPRVSDDNDGKQLTGRLTVAPLAGLEFGASYARGAFISRRAFDEAGVTGGGDQIAYGADVEYGWGRWLARSEAVLSSWDVPFQGEGRVRRLRAGVVGVEGRYTLVPGVYAAVRAEHLAFSRIDAGATRLPWDAPVTRVEAGGGYYLQRNLIARASLQVNRRDGGRLATRANLLSVQLLYWF